MTLPVVANGVPVTMNKPGNPTVLRPVVPTVPTGVLINGSPPALVGFTMGGVGVAVVSLLSTVLFDGLPCALVGALVTCTDGYSGAFDATHGPGGAVDVT